MQIFYFEKDAIEPFFLLLLFFLCAAFAELHQLYWQCSTAVNISLAVKNHFHGNQLNIQLPNGTETFEAFGTGIFIQNKLPDILNLSPALLVIFQNAHWRGSSRCCGLRARSEDLARESAKKCWGTEKREALSPASLSCYTCVFSLAELLPVPLGATWAAQRSTWRVTPVGVMMETAAFHRKNTKDGWMNGADVVVFYRAVWTLWIV